MSKRKEVPGAKTALAANVKRLREAMGISQEKLAEKAGFHRTYVSQIERCLSNITLDNLERLAKELNVPAFVLIRHGEETPAKAATANKGWGPST